MTAAEPVFPSRETLDSYADEAERKIAAAATLAELEELAATLTGKRSPLVDWHRLVGRLSADEKPAAGEELKKLRARLEPRLAERERELAEIDRAQRLVAERLDLSEVLPTAGPGHLHLVTQVREQLEDVFVGMGYEIAEGPEVESDWYNFTALNIPKYHPARSSQDSFYLDVGDRETYLLRTQTSPVQIRLLERGELPIYAVAPGRVYRRDTPDARHLPIFHQIEGLVVDEGVTFGDLAGTIDTFVRAIFGSSRTSRLRPGYFPFTEPSAEFDISCTICDGEGCRTCSGTGWIELGGCGMVHPAVFEATGVDPERWTGFAFGFGIDRLAIMAHEVDDLRSFIDNDIRFLTQF